jgi:hypothetical protein
LAFVEEFKKVLLTRVEINEDGESVYEAKTVGYHLTKVIHGNIDYGDTLLWGDGLYDVVGGSMVFFQEGCPPLKVKASSSFRVQEAVKDEAYLDGHRDGHQSS